MSRYGLIQSPGECAQEIAKSPKQITRREQLEWRRSNIQSELDAVNKAIAALDAHPELEDFIETLARAGA